MLQQTHIALVVLLVALFGAPAAVAGETGAPINQGIEISQNPLDDDPGGSGSTDANRGSSTTATGNSSNATAGSSSSTTVGSSSNAPTGSSSNATAGGSSSTTAGASAAGAVTTGETNHAPVGKSDSASSSNSSQEPAKHETTSSSANQALAPGPLLDRRNEILNFLNKAKKAGIGVKPYEAALESIETDVKAGKTEAEIKPRVNSLVVALSKQVENLKSLKAAAASKAASAQAGGFPMMGTPESNSGFGFENGVFKIKPARPLSRSVSGLFAGLSPEYQKYATINGRGVPEALMERLLFDLTNKHRRENNLKPYSWNSKLAGLAKGHARDMATNNFFAHVNKRHQGPLDRSMAAGYNVGVRENIGMAGAGRGTPLGMVILVDDGLMKSPGHRAAILDPKGQGAGMGVCYDLKNGGIKVCQVFSPNDF